MNSRSQNSNLPTEFDMNLTQTEIAFLNGQEASLVPQLRTTFHDQLKSAELQLSALRAELKDPRLTDVSRSLELRKTIITHWRKLSATLTMADAYCV